MVMPTVPDPLRTELYGFQLKLEPLGRPPTDRLTVPENPPIGVTLTTLPAGKPGRNNTGFGPVVITVKSGCTAGVKLTVPLADLLPSATLVAVTVTVCAPAILPGAVYSPLDTVPTTGLIDQFTAVFDVPVTVAVNCCVCD
jgi:hypothetical protein